MISSTCAGHLTVRPPAHLLLHYLVSLSLCSSPQTGSISLQAFPDRLPPDVCFCRFVCCFCLPTCWLMKPCSPPSSKHCVTGHHPVCFISFWHLLPQLCFIIPSQCFCVVLSWHSTKYSIKLKTSKAKHYQANMRNLLSAWWNEAMKLWVLICLVAARIKNIQSIWVLYLYNFPGIKTFWENWK